MEEDLQSGLAKAGIRDADYHIFICIGPDCCASEEGERTWSYIKQRVKETGLRAMRTKAACFRICTGGPWMVIYPDGVWYGAVTAERFERILQEHLLGGKPASEWVAAVNRLENSRGT